MKAALLLTMLLTLMFGAIPAAAVAGPIAAEPPSSTARGVLRAEREAVLASPLAERITSMPYKEGASFARGATLVAFDCSRMGAELAAARAGHAAEARNAQMQTDLLGMGAAGRGEADIAVEHAKEKDAQAQAISRRMADCRVVAPFAGRVVETLVRESETPPPNHELIRIVSQGALELHMVVPSRWLAWMQLGSPVGFKVDETGDVLEAKVLRISGAVDAVSQTVKVVASVAQVPKRVLPGMSGQVSFKNAAAAQKSKAGP